MCSLIFTPIKFNFHSSYITVYVAFHWSMDNFTENQLSISKKLSHANSSSARVGTDCVPTSFSLCVLSWHGFAQALCILFQLLRINIPCLLQKSRLLCSSPLSLTLTITDPIHNDPWDLGGGGINYIYNFGDYSIVSFISSTPWPVVGLHANHHLLHVEVSQVRVESFLDFLNK